MGLRTKILRALRARRASRAVTKPRAPEVFEPMLDREQIICEANLVLPIQYLTLERIRALSMIETLPTELVEQIASYLIHDYKPPREDDEMLVDFGGCVELSSFVKFRQTSRSIHQKTDLLFARCFETHVVTFTNSGILGLLEMATCEYIRSRVRFLIFMAPDPDRAPAYGDDDALYKDALSAYSQNQHVSEWLRYDPTNTTIDVAAMIAAAMKRLQLVSIFVAPNLIKQHSMGHRHRHWGLDAHPPTVIFNAMILSGLQLEQFDMGIPEWGSYAGMMPATNCLNVFKLRHWALEDLTSITLVLSKPMSVVETPAQLYADKTLGRLPHMLGHCWNLRKLELGLDKTTIEDNWEHLANAHSVWTAICDLDFWNLKDFKLSGFVLDYITLIDFLFQHKQSLVSLNFDNCYLAGCWRDALYLLHEMPNLRNLMLNQVTNGRYRVLWSTPYDDDDRKPLLDDDEEEWVNIRYFGSPNIALTFREHRKEESIRELMGMAFETMRLVRVKASPFAKDALDWDWYRLPG